ncbi:T9SS type A sorting domain-containing protein [candidate division KSB1 bacterium]|nr:T9SS type A sorting domain-containing protein [candidate division KSB1 bacterium]
MKQIICVLFLSWPGMGLAQTAAEMSSPNYAIVHSAVVGAGGAATNTLYLLQHGFSSSTVGSMAGGQFVIGTAVVFITDGDEALPEEFSLSQNYPNPFNQSTAFRYSVPCPSDIKISIHSVLGQEIAILLQSEQGAGRYTLVYAGRDGLDRPLPSGLYFCRLTTKGFDKTIKFAILR